MAAGTPEAPVSLLFVVWLCCGCAAPPAPLPPPARLSAPPPAAAPPAAVPHPTPPILGAITPGSGLVYEVYVRSFQDSDGDGNGDLAGLTTRLDYLTSIGVTAVWLMPVAPSATPDGAAVIDHAGIAADYGDEEALRRLVIAAHEHDLHVLIEAPLNAVSALHPAFVTALADPTSPERALFRFRSTAPEAAGWVPAGGEWYYAAAGPDLPELDWTNPDVMDLVLGAQRTGLALGVDGYVYRDLASLVEEEDPASEAAHARLAEIRSALTAAGDDVYLLTGTAAGPVADNTAWLGTPDAPEADALLDPQRHDALLAAFTTGDGAALIDVLAAEGADPARLDGYLGSDRTPRLVERLPDPCARRAAMVVHLLSAGQPVLYYGEELDLADTRGDTLPDDPWRGLMRWDATQDGGFSRSEPWFPLDPSDRHDVEDELADPNSMLRLVKSLADLRSQSLAARTGIVTVLPTYDARALAFVRSSDRERVVVVVNLTGEEVDDLRVEVSGAFQDLTAPDAAPLAEAPLAFGALAPYAYRVLVEGVDRGHPIPVLRCEG